MRKVDDLAMEKACIVECVEASVGIGGEDRRSGVYHHHRRLSKSSTALPATGVHELLECPVCANFMYPPIHQCSNGHSLCSTCKLMAHIRCPTCRQDLGDIRCLALEKVAESLDLLASIAHSVAHRSFHTFACLNMNLSAVSDHIIVLMRDMSAQ